MPITNDQRFNFRSIPLTDGDVASLTIDVTGGPLARVQAIAVNKAGAVVNGVGSHGFGTPLTTAHGGRVRWSFNVDTSIAFVKWGVVAIRSAANLGDYTVVARISNSSGGAVDVARFDAAIEEGKVNDDMQLDAVTLAVAVAAVDALPVGGTL